MRWQDGGDAGEAGLSPALFPRAGRPTRPAAGNASPHPLPRPCNAQAGQVAPPALHTCRSRLLPAVITSAEWTVAPHTGGLPPFLAPHLLASTGLGRNSS